MIESVFNLKVGRNHIVVENTKGTMNYTFSAELFEPCIFGLGNTHEEAVQSVLNSAKKLVHEMETAINEHFAKPKIT